MEGLEMFFCWNKSCPEYGIRGGNNIRVRAWFGKHNDIRLLYCLTCKARSTERGDFATLQFLCLPLDESPGIC